ncbi:DNA (cytosine-5)-methyltransferase 1 [Sphingomonas sp. PP-CE-1A-559]|nr:DNA (cytosine-5)-methyltransferase 1 [Sphingomonas sp. PP-CE-1A-559]
MREMISLFSGLGGLDVGLEEAGWRCLHASDIDPRAVESLKANQGFKLSEGVKFLEHAQVEQADVCALNGKALLDQLGRRRGDVELLAGGPPCQSWSSAGHQLGFSDPRGMLINEYLRLAGELDCRYILFENVRGLVTARGADGVPGSALAHLRDRLLDLGYHTSVELLNAADFGVPQRRVRIVVLGYRDGDAPIRPAPTHSKERALGTRSWQTMDEALCKLAACRDDEVIRPSGKLAAELASIQPGSGVKSPGKKESTRPGGHWGYKQGAFVADLARPARTVTANAQQDWIRDPKLGLRRLTPRECATLQTFPDGWIVKGNRADSYRLVGNAVPPRLARAVGEALLLGTCQQSVAEELCAKTLAPLPDKLRQAIEYTMREERRNGASRKAAPVRRVQRVTA